MKRIYFYLFISMAMLMLSFNSAWAVYVKVTNGETVSWIEIAGVSINGTNIIISGNGIIGYSAFYENPKGSIDLNEVWSESSGIGIHYQVTRIEEGTFYGCSDLTSVVIPSSVTNIGGAAFYGCSGLASIIIPSSVKSIEDYAFYCCSGLTSVEIHSGVASIGNSVFEGCSGITSIDIPSSVTSIGNSAFQGCRGLTSVEIPSGVTSIGNSAFQGCRGLTSIVIPSSVTSIGGSAFYNCNNVNDIYSEIKDVFVTGTNAFLGCENATLHVPAGTYVAYSGRADWNRIVHIVEGSEEFKMTLACNTKGNVLVNDETNFTSKIGEVDVKEQVENTFVFTPKDNCKLEQVLLNGLDVTASIENNTLKAVIPAKSQMVVTFAKESGDMNNDGIINISDVVVLVNMILGQ